MIRDIVRFEWRFHTRQISFVAAALLFFVFGFALTATGFGPPNVNVDSPYSIAQSIGLLSLFALFVLAVFCANAVVRDRETGMEEIVFTTSVEKLPFLLGRFTGSFLAAFTAFSTCALGMFVARFMPWHDADRVGDLSVVPYLWALLVIALPNLLFGAVVLFGLATVTRSVLASYAGSVLLYVLYFVAAAMTNSPLMASSQAGAGGVAGAALLDPFALSAFFEQTAHWTQVERNTRLVGLSGGFLGNRVLWVGLSVVGLAATYRLFSFRVISRGVRAAAEPPQSKAAAELPHSKFASALSLEIRAFVFSRASIAMLLLWVGLIAFEMISDLGGGEYGSAFYPTPALLLATIRQPLSIVATILLIYVSAEMVWRERAVRFAGILNATPAPNALFVAAKCAALAVLVLTLTFTALGAAAVVQLVKGWPVEPLLLLSFAWFLAAPLILFAVIAVIVQILSPHKYVGMLLVLMIAMSRLIGELAGVRHPLARFATAPDVSWSDLGGFGRTADFHWSMLYWSAIAGVLLLVAISRWRERREPVACVPAIALLIVAIAGGAFIAVNTNNLDLVAWRAKYEKNYKRFTSLPQPRVVSMKVHFDLHPDDYRYRVRGTYVLRNDTRARIDNVLVTTRRGVKPAIVAVHPPLAPGKSMALHFELEHAAGALESADYSYITSARALPFVGYVGAFEIDDPRERRRRRLPPAAVRPEREIPIADWVTVDLTVSTSPDHRVVAPGTLQREWEEGGRRHVRFRTDAPIAAQFGIGSARYAVTRESHGRVAIEVYHHPRHDVNVRRMLRAARESLDVFEKSFGPYQHPHLRVAEVSIPNFSGFAQPGVVFLGETRGFLFDARDPHRLDITYRRLAHEIAHQWWGYTLIPADVPGATTLSESLTKYSEQLALEKAYGAGALQQLLDYDLDLYLSGRTGETGAEPPLARAGDQSYLYYRKGAIVMNGLRDLLGTANVNAALRNLLREHGGPSRRPTTTHLVEHLRAVAPPQHHALIDEWMNDVVLYDLKLDAVTTRYLGKSLYSVTLTVTASKRRANGEALPMNEEIAIAVGNTVTKHPLRSGTQEITVVAEGRPFLATLDPNLTRVDRNRFDNVLSVNISKLP